MKRSYPHRPVHSRSAAPLDAAAQRRLGLPLLWQPLGAHQRA